MNALTYSKFGGESCIWRSWMTVLIFCHELSLDFLSRETVSISNLLRPGFSGWSCATFWPPSLGVTCWNWRIVKMLKRTKNWNLFSILIIKLIVEDLRERETHAKLYGLFWKLAVCTTWDSHLVSRASYIWMFQTL